MKQGIYSIALIAVGVLLGLLLHSQYDVYKADQAREEQHRHAIEALQKADEKSCVIGGDLEECVCKTEDPRVRIVLPADLCWKHVDKAHIKGTLNIAD